MIKTRTDLINALRLATELEHQLMCQYLFAAYSLKKFPWEGLDQVELETVRRWGSYITLIARQEMEHLGLALNLLSAVGGTPSFSRPNMPQRIDYYGDANIKMTFTRCDTKTIERFQRFEAPDDIAFPYTPLRPPPCEKPQPEPGPVDKQKSTAWCDRANGVDRDEVMRKLEEEPPPPAGEILAKGAPHIDLAGTPYDSVQDLYHQINEGFELLAKTMGEPLLFVGNPVNQIWGGPGSPLYGGDMDNLNQYGLVIIQVTNLQSAQQAIRMIVEQGEGIRVPPSYLPHTHFCLFTKIRDEMAKTGLGDRAARNVARNPMTVIWPDVYLVDEVTLITNDDTRRVAQLFNDCYEVMLLLLLYLYSDQVKTSEQIAGFMDAAFFPFMTMFIRPIAEILTELPVADDPSLTAGPGFELNGDVMLFPSVPQMWTLFQERIDALVAQFQIICATDPWIDLPNQKTDKSRHSRVWDRLDYLRQNMERLALDWKENWMNVGRREDAPAGGVR